MNFTVEQTGEFLKDHDGYLILTHVRPDGDTVGCAAALCRGLRDLGKTAHVLPNPETTSLFSPYLEGLLAPEDFCPETVVSVDMAARGLFPDNAQQYLERVDLAIDHGARILSMLRDPEVVKPVNPDNHYGEDQEEDEE